MSKLRIYNALTEISIYYHVFAHLMWFSCVAYFVKTKQSALHFNTMVKIKFKMGGGGVLQMQLKNIFGS